MAAIYSLYIINKSGGLIFYKDYGSAGRMDTNDSLRVASFMAFRCMPFPSSFRLFPVVRVLNSLKPTHSTSIASSHLLDVDLVLEK
ncbi:hypothetical protein SDJN02_08312 [Cucurbita argyrosperma subsp. argyrosperma]|nr:hypothetical protein SDJN02_08312 [Cucurbita argyrosperma subsp. argyrosperma]